MRGVFFLIMIVLLWQNMRAQPADSFPAIDPKDTGLVSSPARRTWEMKFHSDFPIEIDGDKDSYWDQCISISLDHYLLGKTTFLNGKYVFTSSPGLSLPNSPDDFSASFAVTYDQDYLYGFFDITDNEVNEGTFVSGLNEMLQLFVSPYSDSMQQRLNGKTIAYNGTAPEINKKFAYWAQLGAFQINFKIIADEKCDISIRKTEDSSKINYEQRANASKCAWKLKPDGTGYTIETAIDFKTTLSDSAGNPFYFRCPNQSLAFDIVLTDKDSQSEMVKRATWNAQNENVWDAMLYTGKLMPDYTRNYANDCFNELTQYEENSSFFPNPATNTIIFNNPVQQLEIISINGAIVKSAINVQELNVSDLENGLYVVKAEGKVIGKMVKE